MVLVFDRDADTRARYRAAFESANYRVAEAADGMAAVQFLTSRLPDLVVTELRSGHRDGLTLCIVTRSTAAIADVPILIVMLDEDPEVEAAARLVGTSALLKTPRVDASAVSVADRLMLDTPSAHFTRRQLHRTLVELRQNASAYEPRAGSMEGHARELLTHVTAALSSIVLTNDEAKCMAVNAAACELTGYSESELLDRSVWDLARPDTRGHAHMLWARFLSSGECAGEFLMIQKDGEEVPIQLCALTNIAPGLHATVADRESSGA
jgi:PAS domain S-box-containing protein